jgi:hypothetical protein
MKDYLKSLYKLLFSQEPSGNPTLGVSSHKDPQERTASPVASCDLPTLCLSASVPVDDDATFFDALSNTEHDDEEPLPKQPIATGNVGGESTDRKRRKFCSSEQSCNEEDAAKNTDISIYFSASSHRSPHSSATSSPSRKCKRVRSTGRGLGGKKHALAENVDPSVAIYVR